MHNKKGTTLLVFLMYMVLFSMVTFFICQIITFLIIPSTLAMRKCQSLIALHIATDLFVRDIKTIKNEKDCWKTVTPHELIWNQDGQEVGWLFSHDRLERREKGSASIIAKNITQASFSVEKNKNEITAIELTLHPAFNKEKIVTCFVALAQGNTHEK